MRLVIEREFDGLFFERLEGRSIDGLARLLVGTCYNKCCVSYVTIYNSFVFNWFKECETVVAISAVMSPYHIYFVTI